MHAILECRSFVEARRLALAAEGDAKLPAWAEDLYAPVLEARYEENMAAMLARREQGDG